MLIKEGKNAVNVTTDRWLCLDENLNVTIGQRVILSNKKEYEVVGFIGDNYMKVVGVGK